MRRAPSTEQVMTGNPAAMVNLLLLYSGARNARVLPCLLSGSHAAAGKETVLLWSETVSQEDRAGGSSDSTRC